MEKYGIDWDEPLQKFRIRSKFFEFSEMRQIDRVFELTNTSLLPFFLLLNKYIMDGSEKLCLIGGDILYNLLYTHFNRSQLMVRAVRYVLTLPYILPRRSAE